jgi:hypothetical protein
MNQVLVGLCYTIYLKRKNNIQGQFSCLTKDMLCMEEIALIEKLLWGVKGVITLVKFVGETTNDNITMHVILNTFPTSYERFI